MLDALRMILTLIDEESYVLARDVLYCSVSIMTSGTDEEDCLWWQKITSCWWPNGFGILYFFNLIVQGSRDSSIADDKKLYKRPVPMLECLTFIFWSRATELSVKPKIFLDNWALCVTARVLLILEKVGRLPSRLAFNSCRSIGIRLRFIKC